MRKVLLLALVPLTLASAQVLKYRGKDGDWSVDAGGGSLTFVGGSEYRFELSKAGGLVYIHSQKQGLEIWSPKLVANIVQSKGAPSPIKRVSTQGSIRVLRKGGGEVSELSGSGGVFSATGSNTANVSILGPVHLTNVKAGKTSIDMRGNSASAVLTNSFAKAPLQSATVNGNVVLNAVQAKDGSKLQLRGARLVYAGSGAEATITITGGVHATGGQAGGNFDLQVSRAVLYLNKTGAVYKFDFT